MRLTQISQQNRRINSPYEGLGKPCPYRAIAKHMERYVLILKMTWVFIPGDLVVIERR